MVVVFQVGALGFHPADDGRDLVLVDYAFGGQLGEHLVGFILLGAALFAFHLFPLVDQVGDVVGLGLGDDSVGYGCGEQVGRVVVVVQVGALGFHPADDGRDLVLVDDALGGQLGEQHFIAVLRFAPSVLVLIIDGSGVGVFRRSFAPVLRGVPVRGGPRDGGLLGGRRGLRRGLRAAVLGDGHHRQKGDGGQQADHHGQYLFHGLSFPVGCDPVSGSHDLFDRAPSIRPPHWKNLKTD